MYSGIAHTNKEVRAGYWLLALSVLLSVMIGSLPGWRVRAERQVSSAHTGPGGLAAALTEDGRLKTGTSGSFDARGYRLELTPSGAPRFVPSAQPAACDGWDTQFGMSDGVSGQVYALATNGNDLYLGGSFKVAGPAPVLNVAKFNTLTNTWSALGTEGNGVYGYVSALALSGNELYVGGNFPTVKDGVRRLDVNNLAKFNTATGVWSLVGAGGVNNTVWALALSGSDLFVGGEFTATNIVGPSITVRGLAKVNTTSGVWSALGIGGGNGVDGKVYALALSGMDLVVGGSFTTANVGGVAVGTNNLAKVSTVTGVWSALGNGDGNGVDGAVYALVASASNLYLGGSFNTANVGSAPVTVGFAAKFDTLTNTWSALGMGGNNGVNSHVRSLALSGNDLYLGGYFTTANVSGTSISLKRLAKFNTLTHTWSAVGSDGGNGVDGGVQALIVGGSGLYVGGLFAAVNVGAASTSLTANNVATVATATGVWSRLDSGGNGLGDLGATVSALAVSGNDLYIGGGFFYVGSIPARHVAKFNLLTNTWSALGTGGGQGIEIGSVSALAVIGNDLYVGGSLESVNSGGPLVPANRIAKVNTTTGVWSALGSAGGNGVSGSIAGVIPAVNSLAVIGSDLYVGGVFTTANVGGPPVSAHSVAKYNTATGVWSAIGSGDGGDGVDYVVRALAVRGTDLFVGGYFTMANVGGTPVNANRVAKVNTVTGVWSALGAGISNGQFDQVYALAIDGNDLYVGGQFTRVNVGVTPVSAHNVAKVNTTTGVWSALGAGGEGVNGSVFVLTVLGSDLYVGGQFSAANVGGALVSAKNVAKLSTTTGDWNGLLDSSGGDGVDREVFALTMHGTDLFAGGLFTVAGDHKISLHLGRYCTGGAGNGLQYYPLPAPVRLLETRAFPPNLPGCLKPNAPVNANETVTFAARLACVGLPANAAAITGNLTVVPASPGYLTLYASDATRPTVASTNFKAGEITNNLFTVGLGANDGAFNLFASAQTEVIMDVTGYYAPPGNGGLYFHPLPTPVRLLETRNNPSFTGCVRLIALLTGTGDPNANPALDFTVPGRAPIAGPCNVIPATAQVLVGNATTVSPASSGYLTLYPSGAARSVTASSNYAGGDVINGPFAVKLGTDGTFKVYTFATTDLVLDISGYFSAEAVDENGAGLLFYALPQPLRLLETRLPFTGRAGCYFTNYPIAGGGNGLHTQPAWGACGGQFIPATAQALLGNATVISPAAAGFLTIFPGDVANNSIPSVATSNYPFPVLFGYNRHFFTRLSPADGTFKVLTSATSELIVDVAGYFAP